MADNPRIDELRKRLEREPGSRLFAQLGEELRKDGDLSGAIRVCREGLQKHPQYPSARMTLGRALFDSGDLAAAKVEFEAVLKGAPDNILAARLLGESLEGLEDWLGAAAQYRKALMMAPGDKQLQAHLEAVEDRMREPAPTAAQPSGAEPAPIKLSAVDEPMELERPFESRATQVGEPVEFTGTMPIPVTQVEEDFEIERPQEAPTVAVKAPAAPAPAPVPKPPPAREEVVEFDEAPTMPGTLPGMAVEVEFEPTTLPPPTTLPASPQIEAIPVSVVAPPRAPEPQEPLLPVVEAEPSEEIASVTLADLYMRQGFTDKAVQVLEQLLAREPGNQRAQTRLREVKSAPASPPTMAEGPTNQAKRVVIQRTIDRLEAMLAAIRKG